MSWLTRVSRGQGIVHSLNICSNLCSCVRAGLTAEEDENLPPAHWRLAWGFALGCLQHK